MNESASEVELFGALARDPGGVVALGHATGRGTDVGQRSRQHPGQQDGQDDARERRQRERGEDHGGDRLVVHRARVLGGVAGLDHERGEHLGTDHGHADREDHEAHGRRREGGEGDPDRDPAAHQASGSTRAAR